MALDVCYPATAVWARPALLDTEADPSPTDEAIAANLLAVGNADLAEAFAWYALQALTGYQLAICPTIVRPCKKSCRNGTYYTPALGLPFAPRILPSGAWINVWCGHNDECSCTEIEQITLPGPIGHINSVTIDGDVLEPEAYRVDNGNKLVRQDGGTWPTCQDMNLPEGEAGTFVVSYMRGFGANSMSNHVAGVLAAEFYLGINGDKKCRLKSNVTAVTRQGVSFEMAAGLFANGVTGLPEVDSYVATLNPHGLKTRPVIMSPDSIGIRQTTIGRR